MLDDEMNKRLERLQKECSRFPGIAQRAGLDEGKLADMIRRQEIDIEIVERAEAELAIAAKEWRKRALGLITGETK